MKALKIAGVVIAVIVTVLALPLVFGLPIGFLTTALQDRVERDTGYHLTIAGSASASLWPTLNVALSDVTLRDPRDRDGNNRLTIGSLKAEVTLSSLWSGRPEVSDLTIARPALYLPLMRERLRDSPSRGHGPAKLETSAVLIDRVTVTDGAVIFSNPRDRVEDRIDAIGAKAVLSANSKLRLTGSARAGERPLTFDIKADAPAMPVERQTIPVAFDIDMPGTLRVPLSGRAELRLNGQVLTINGLSGMLDDGAFNGWASIELASKPLVKLDLDVQRLELPWSSVAAANQQGWSTAPIDIEGLNYIDARVRLSASELKAAGARLGPVAIEASLAGGVLKAAIGNVGLYDGQASGEVIIDASSGNPAYAMHCDLVGVRALPLLQNLADFDRLDARMQAKLALRSSGASQQSIMSNLSGSAFLMFQDGAIRGINVAQMVRQLTSNPLTGWQDAKELSTDLTQLSASFQVERGQATTSDLALIGPLVKVTGAGSIDLGNRTLAMRVEPKLVMSTEGQGRAADPVGLGIPVKVVGPWSQPQIYPDMAGMLDNPQAAYARLKQMGQGLFGKDGSGLNTLITGIGGLIGNAAPGGQAGPTGETAPAAPNAPADAAPTASADPLGGQLGATIGNLIQQGMQQGLNGRRRTIAPSQLLSSPSGPSLQDPQGTVQGPARGSSQGTPQNDLQDSTRDAAPDSQPMNDMLRRLFSR
jgi:AsmA protein